MIVFGTELRTKACAALGLLTLLTGFGGQARAEKSAAFYFPEEGKPKRLVHFEPWPGGLPARLDQRLARLSPELQSVVIADLVGSGISAGQLRPADDLPVVRRDLETALGKMPEAVYRLISNTVYGFYLVHNLGCTGYSTEFYDSPTATMPVGGIVVLDADRLSIPGSDWFSEKESRTFKPDGHFKIRVSIARPGFDSPESGLMYVTLHEIAHILSVGRNFHPHWDLDQWSDDLTERDYPFLAQSWTIRRRQIASTQDVLFPERAQLQFFGTPILPIDQAPLIYEHLEKTNFPTLFASSEPFDDFADSFASYVYNVVMRQPFSVDVFKDGQLAKHMDSCWNQFRCNGKAKILEAFLSGN